MNKICRFCRKGETSLLFPATKETKAKSAVEFTCTNCGFGIHGPIVKCQSCQIVYIAETISQEKISTYYEVADDPMYFAEQPARELTFKNYLKRLEKIYPKKGKLLDIGTNTGLFIYLARENGWDATGIEPNKWAVEYAAKNFKVKIIPRSYELNTFKPESFDVITMWDVIEHFVDPISKVASVNRHLKPNGLFAFSTIDPDSPFAKIMGTHWSWYMEMHRVFFSRTAATNYLYQAGFQKVAFKAHFRNLSLGYLATRFQAINPALAGIASGVIGLVGLDKVIVPYYANDLYDCYAFK